MILYVYEHIALTKSDCYTDAKYDIMNYAFT